MPNSKKSEVKGGARATIDHDEIRAWVEEHGGTPATVKRTRRGDTAGIIRIDFPGYSGEKSLEAISWEEFFQKFDESKLALLIQDRTASGRPSRFNKFVARDTVELASSNNDESINTRKPQRTMKTRQKAAQAKPTTSTRMAKSESRSPARGTRRATGESARTNRDSSTRSAKTQHTAMNTSSAPRSGKRAESSTRKKASTTRRSTAKKSASSAAM